MKIAFSTNNIYQIERFSKKYKIKNFKKINFSTLNRSELRSIKLELLNKISEERGDIAQVDQEASLEGRQLLMILSPLKKK